MSESIDLRISDATLLDHAEPATIEVSGGTITSLEATSAVARETVDAGGSIVLPAFTDGHLHVCKAYTRDLAGDRATSLYSVPGMGATSAADAIDVAAHVKSSYDDDATYRSAYHALLSGVKHGVGRVRAFADTDSAAGLHGVRGALRARDELQGLIDVEVVAFPQDGVIRDPGAASLVRQALELGADVVGGIPWIEATVTDQREHVRQMMDLAEEFDRDVAMLVDDAGDASLRTLEMLAREALDRGWQGRVVACHARALAAYDDGYFRDLLALLGEARVGIITDPHTGAVFLRAVDLAAGGIDVGIGQDDIADAYYPYGQHNLLEVAFLTSHLWRRFDDAGQRMVVDMVTTGAARALGDDTRTIRRGAPADLVVTGQPTIAELLRYHQPPPVVLHGGRIVATNRSAVAFPSLPDAPDLLVAIQR